ncbi:MAG: DUF4912 domain-containing protein [Syntrophomonadaceae bacterium]|nr:DUF4912 domain-containing protein [Syntrophomonadaceae bacterium]
MSSDILGLVLLLLALLSALIIGLQGKKKTHPPEKGPDFKFETAGEISGAAVPEATVPPPVEIPEYYHDEKLVLMVRDPEWLYAYWEISPDYWNEVRQKYGQAASYDNLTLRITELAGEMAYFDIKVGNRIGSWHIHVARPDTPYYGVLGLKLGSDFFPLIVSNAITTPRNAVSPLGDDEWMLVSDYEQRIIKRLGQIPFDATSPFMFRKEGP